MPAKRRVGKMRALAITPEAVEAFRAGDWIALHRALRLRPWEASPLDVQPGDEELTPGSAGARSVPVALELRERLKQQTYLIGGRSLHRGIPDVTAGMLAAPVPT